MRDYQKFEPENPKDSAPTIKLPWLRIFSFVGVITLCLAAFGYLAYNWEKRRDLSSLETQVEHGNLPLPPDDEDYEFYTILDEEEPIRIQRDEEEEVLQRSRNIYYVRVPGYTSFDEARARAKDMLDWGIVGSMRVEPYSEQEKLLFRIRIGPFISRSDMNAQRDILYEKEIINEGVSLRK